MYENYQDKNLFNSLKYFSKNIISKIIFLFNIKINENLQYLFLNIPKISFSKEKYKCFLLSLL